MPSLERHVYFFGNGRADGSAAMRDILGGKGAGLAEMANLGLPVPPGFTISAKLCLAYLETGTFPDGLHEEVDRHLKHLEQETKKKFGDPANPLLVSVRSGAAVSMPGMMETILNLGLNDETVQGLIAGSKNPRFAYDSYRRFVQMYGDVVFDLGREPFQEVLEEFKARRRVQELAHAPRRGLPQSPRHPRRPGDGRERRGDGVREHGRRLGDRRGVHARLPHRGERPERRLPHERPG